MSKVNETPNKGIENYVNLNFDNAKNSEEVQNTIFELAKNAERDLIAMKESDADKYNNGIDDSERIDICNWLFVIGNAFKAIPSKFKSACTNSINKLREVAINLTKPIGTRYTDFNMKVRIDYEGNGTVVFKGESEPAQQTASISEPTETDTESNKYDSDRHQILEYRAEQRLEKLINDKSAIEKDKNWYINNGQPYYGSKPEDVSKIAMQDIANMFLGDSPQEDNAKHLLQWSTEMFYAGKIDGGEKSILTGYAKNALNKIEQSRNNNSTHDMGTVVNNTPSVESIIAQIHNDTPVGGSYGNDAAANAVVAQIHEETPVRKDYRN